MTNDKGETASAGRARHTVPLRPSDFTATGHVSNLRFPELAEIGRMGWFGRLPWKQGSRVPYALIRVMHVDFLGTIRWEVTEVWVDIEVLRIGRTSFTLRTSVGVPGDETPRATVETVHVVTEADEATTLQIDEEERAMLQRYLTQEATA